MYDIVHSGCNKYSDFLCWHYHPVSLFKVLNYTQESQIEALDSSRNTSMLSGRVNLGYLENLYATPMLGLQEEDDRLSSCAAQQVRHRRAPPLALMRTVLYPVQRDLFTPPSLLLCLIPTWWNTRYYLRLCVVFIVPVSLSASNDPPDLFAHHGLQVAPWAEIWSYQ